MLLRTIFVIFTLIISALAHTTDEIKDVMIAITINQRPLFLPEFFEKIYNLNYPKDHVSLHISVQNGTIYSEIKALMKPWSSEYKKIILLPSENPAKAKQEAIHYAKNLHDEYILFMSDVAHLEEPDTLKALISQNKEVVAPFLMTYEKFSYARRICNLGPRLHNNDSHSFPSLVTQKGLREENYDLILIGNNFVTDDVLESRNINETAFDAFWTTIPSRNKEKSTTEYFNDIQEHKKCCVNQVKAVRYAYLVKSEVFPESGFRDMFQNASLSKNTSDPNGLADSIFSQTLNSENYNVPIYVLNDKTYGQLVNIKNVPDKLHPELTRIMENHDLWEKRYIQEKVIKTTTKDPEQMPEILPKETVQNGNCPDTYQIPIFTKIFCEHWIEEAEFADNWFASGNDAVYDARNKRAETVPTTDINLWQYGLEEVWMAFINFYIYPRKCIFYPGHPGQDTGGHFFTVRYRWEEQPALKPHHDNSMFSMNLALNKIGQDFEGGGTYFLRQNCSDLTLDIGTILLHPGRVTHFHEGLSTTSGTRYIMVSFVNSAYNCYERAGVPYCPGYIPKDNYIEESKRHASIARGNEGYKIKEDTQSF